MKDTIQRYMSIPEIEGKVTIELRSDGGKLYRKIEQHNDVSERYLRGMAKIYNYGLLTPASKTTRSIMVPNSSATLQAPMTGLVMTDASDPYSDDDWTIRGVYLGGGEINTAASGDKRGAYNSVESVNEITYQKYVYDFGTNQANGTFQSIYTGRFVNTSSALPSWDVFDPGIGVTDYLSSELDADYRVVMKDNSNLRIVSKEDLFKCAFQGISPWGVGVGYTLSPSASSWSNGKAIYNGRIYWVSGTGNNSVLYSAPISQASGLGSSSSELAFNSGWQSSNLGRTGVSMAGCVYSAYHGGMLIGTITPGSNIGIVLLDPSTWSLIDSWKGPFGGDADYCLMGLVCDPFGSSVVMGTGRSTDAGAMFDLPSGTGQAIALCGFSTGQMGPSFLVDDIIHIGRRTFAYQAPEPNNFFFSRAVLPAPVTKLPTQTMKITYEFQMADPFA